MSRKVLSLAAVVLSMGIGSVWAKQWETDFEKAKVAAQTEGKYMLLDFSGSDWCGWCVRLEKEVFGRKAFMDYAKENLICVLLDFPRSKALSPKLASQNKELAQKYKVKGYPTVIILSPTADTVAQTGYQEGGAEQYVDHLKGFIDKHKAENPVQAAVGTNTTRKVGLKPKSSTKTAGGATTGGKQ
jgi:thioredoxin-related protein